MPVFLACAWVLPHTATRNRTKAKPRADGKQIFPITSDRTLCRFLRAAFENEVPGARVIRLRGSCRSVLICRAFSCPVGGHRDSPLLASPVSVSWTKGSPKFERAFDGMRWISSRPTEIAFHTTAALRFSSTGPRSRCCCSRRARSSRGGLQSDKRLPKTPERRCSSTDIRGRRSWQRSRHSRLRATASTS